MLREFGDDKQNYGWLEFSGVAWVDYDMKEEEILKVKEKMRIDKSHLDVLKKNISKHLEAYQWLIKWIFCFDDLMMTYLIGFRLFNEFFILFKKNLKKSIMR